MNDLKLTTKTQGWIMIGLGVLTALAATMPWVTIAIFSVNGLAGDGKFTLAAGLLLAVMGALLVTTPPKLPRKGTSIASIVFGSTILGVAVYDMVRLTSALSADTDNEFERALLDSASPGIGLILTGLVGIGVLALSVIGLVKARAIEPVLVPEAV